MISNIFYLCFIFNQIKTIFSFVYPDHYCSYDAPFESANTTGYRFKQIYSLGYFSNEEEGKYYSKRFGIYYNSIKNDENDGYNASGIEQFKNDKWFGNEFSTNDEDNENISDEYNLFKKVISRNTITFSSIFTNIQITGYELTYIFPFSLEESNKMNVTINDRLICDNTRIYPINKPKYLTIIVIPTGSLSGDKTYKFSCYDNLNPTKYETSFTININEVLKIKFSSVSKIYLSHYKALVNDNTASQSSKLYYTKNNNKICGNSGDNECLLGYHCSSQKCIKCQNKCSICNDDGGCNRCSPLSDNDDNTDINCEINYIDIAKFNDISTTTNNALISNRVTLGFWLFFPIIQSAQTNDGNVFHVVVEDHIIISIVLNTGKDTITTYCHAKENLFNSIKNFTNSNSFSNVNSYPPLASEFGLSIETPGEEQINKLKRSGLAGQWFHVSCGFNPDSNQLYLNSIINGIDNYDVKDVKPEIIYTDLSTDYTRNTFHFKKIYYDKNNDYTTLKILKAKYLNKKVYIRNLLLFKEYMLHSFKYMYYDYSSKCSDFNEIALFIPFNKIIKEDLNKYKISSFCPSDEISLSSNNEYNDTAPLNFKHLNFLDLNTKFRYVDLTVLEPEPTCSNSEGFCHDGKYFKCKNKIIINLTNDCEDPNCNNKIVFPGIERNEGYCLFNCNNNMKCRYVDEYDNFCNNSNYYNLYYFCSEKTSKNYLYYSGAYNSKEINIDNNTINLESYIIEIWVYIDFQVNPPKTGDNFFKCNPNIANVYFSKNLMYFELFSQKKYLTIYNISSPFKQYEWNKFTISVKKTNSKMLESYFFLNNDFKNPLVNYTGVSYLSTYKLTGITFSKDFGSAYYKNLRIMNGEKVSYKITESLNYLYNDLSQERISGIKAYFPLYSEYIRKNTFYDPKIGEFKSFDENNEKFSMPIFNYGDKFEYHKAHSFTINKISSSSTSLLTSECDSNCERCWGVGKECYECKTGKYLVNKQCVDSSNTFLKTPNIEDNTRENFVIQLDPLVKGYKSITIGFWVKLFGFIETEAEENTLIKFNNNEKIFEFNFNSKQFNGETFNNKYGLNLYINNRIIATDNSFIENFGKWTYISLAYYNIKENYFPIMLKLMVDYNSIEIEPNIQLPDYEYIIIPSNVLALWNDFEIYKDFIVGLITYKTHILTVQNPFTFTSPSFYYNCNNLNSFHPSSSFSCVPDYNEFFNNSFKLNDIKLTYVNMDPSKTSNCDISCVKGCYNNDSDSCTCSSLNANSQFFYNSNPKDIKCKKLPYINFSYKTIQPINELSTAQRTKKYTLQFWVLAYEYHSGNFEGIEIEWTHHLKIYTNPTKAFCKIYDNASSNLRLTLNFAKNKWVFLSCAVDFINNLTSFSYTDVDDKIYKEDSTITSSFDNELLDSVSNSQSELKIKDYSGKEWGLLFYRQIALWRDAYFNSEFLSHVNINTPSLFPDLLHIFKPDFNIDRDYTKNYNEYLKTKDLVNSDKILTVNYDSSQLYGINKFPTVNDIKFCSENGEFYDTTSKSCIQFLDLSKVSDFNFTEIPNSYSGSYSMGFWFFLEDSSILTDSSGIDVNWGKHMQISIVLKNNKLEGVCFPQGYDADEYNTFTEKYDNTLNRKRINLLNDNDISSGTWVWTICSVSNYLGKYYILGNNNNVENLIEDLITETLYIYNDLEIKKIYPLRYYMSDINNNNLSTPTTLSIKGIEGKTSQIYMRSIQLFRDYIPPEYLIKYIDFSAIKMNEMSSLLMACNFAKYNMVTKALTYYTFGLNTSEPQRSYIKIPRTVSLTPTVSDDQIALSANFVFLSICNPYNYYYHESKCQIVSEQSKPIINQYFLGTSTTSINNYLTCSNSQILSITDNVNNYTECANDCKNNQMRIPGSPEIHSICNMDCLDNMVCCKSSSLLQDYKSYFKCNDNTPSNPKYIIDYKCYNKNQNENSAIFVSRCSNMPNFMATIATEVKNKINTGYIFEIWIKLEHVLTTCSKKSTFTNEYYLYTQPHTIYKANGEFYYQIINSAYKQLLSLNKNEWIFVFIKTEISNTGSNAYVYINKDLNEPQATFKNIPTSTNMALQTISFCTHQNNGFCLPGTKVNINWGAAYYKNMRVWNLKDTTLQVIEAYNNKVFTDKLTGLILYWPMNIEYSNNNVIKNIIGNSNDNDFVVTHSFTKNFDTNDDFTFFNYEVNFDFGADNKYKYINSIHENKTISIIDCHESCLRCYGDSSTNCYECDSANNYILVNNTCKLGTGYYFKSHPTQNIILNNQNIFSNSGPIVYSINFWMKFFGKESTKTSNPKIMIFSDDIYLYYNEEKTSLDFFISNVLYSDTNFGKYFGQWIQISINNYLSYQYSEFYPHIFTFLVNNIDIPLVNPSYTIDEGGIRLEGITISSETIALYSELIVYTTFIHGAYGKIKSMKRDDSNTLKFKYNFYATLDEHRTNPLSCLNNTMVQSSNYDSLGGNYECILDYNIYMDNSKLCNNDDKFFDINKKTGELPCTNCDETCKTYCYGTNSRSCTCDLTDGLYWLRKYSTTNRTYCEYLPYIDYSVIDNFNLKVPNSYTNESTLEFWVYIYNYNLKKLHFNQIDLEWDLHNKVTIKLSGTDSILIQCFGLYSSVNADLYTEYLQESMSPYSWVHVKCGTSLIGYETSEHYFFLNSVSKTLTATNLPNRTENSTTFKIYYTEKDDKVSTGFVFIREIKLWQQNNLYYIDSKYINLQTLGSYNLTDHKSSSIYPGLLVYIKSEFDPKETNENGDVIESEWGSFKDDVLEKKRYKFINLLGSRQTILADEKDSTVTETKSEENPFPYKFRFYRKDNFIGYNYVDQHNTGEYQLLRICSEGKVYNSSSSSCTTLTATTCQYPGDLSNKCITCPSNAIYINVNGSCVSKCEDGYYGDDHMNQCRKCHSTCSTCANNEFGQDGWMDINCLSCSGDLYFLKMPSNITGYYKQEFELRCISVCEKYGFTRSKTDGNNCTLLEFTAELIDHSEEIPINIYEFTYIAAKITFCTAFEYTTEWSFNEQATIEANEAIGITYTLPEGLTTPFNGDVSLLNTTLNHEFFVVDTIYVFTLTVTSSKTDDDGQTYSVSESFSWNLIMNGSPENGQLIAIPSVGLFNTTNFIIKTFDWVDDNTEIFDYKFTSKEVGINKVLLLNDWSKINEIVCNFTVDFYSQRSSIITITVQVRDKYNAISSKDFNITISNGINNGVYEMETAVDSIVIDEETTYTPAQLYHLSELLMSIGMNPHQNNLVSFQIQTEYQPNVDATEITLVDPICKAEYCNNGNGDCHLTDILLSCGCKENYYGTNCQIHGDVKKLETKYIELYKKIMSALSDEMSYEEFMTIHNLYEGAYQFFTNDSFFTNDLETFLTLCMKNYEKNIFNNTLEFIDFYDYYWAYYLDKLNKLRISKQINNEEFIRNYTLNDEEKSIFDTAFKNIRMKLTNFLVYITSLFVSTQKEFIYKSNNFYIVLKTINPSFNEDEFFADRKSIYRPYVNFMNCLNYIETNNLGNPYYSAWFLFIDFLNYPFSHDEKIYNITVSPLVEYKFIDSTTAKEISVTGCTDNNQMTISVPFNSYIWINEINRQKDLYDPNNYKSPDDPIFSDPIYIENNGHVSNDTVEQRIEKYNRLYNITPQYFDDSKDEFSSKGITYVNLTSDFNYIQFNSTHLSSFSCIFEENNSTFKVNGRFFYLGRLRLFKYSGNYFGNKSFYIIMIVFLIFLISSIIFGIYEDYIFDKEQLMEYLKREIVRSFVLYEKNQEVIIEYLVPSGFHPGFIADKKFHTNKDPTDIKEKIEIEKQIKEDELNKEKENKFKRNFFKLNKKKNTKKKNKKGEVLVLEKNNPPKKYNKNKDYDEEIIENGMSTIKTSKKMTRKINEKSIVNKKNNFISNNSNKNDIINIYSEKDIDNYKLDVEIDKNILINLGVKNTDFSNDNIESEMQLNPNKIPENFDDEEKDKKLRIKRYDYLSLSTSEFFLQNIKLRHNIFTSFFNVSLFNQRWKKLTILITEIYIHCFIISLLLTNNEKVTNKKLGLCFGYAFVAVLLQKIFCYLLPFFFYFNYKQRKTLFNVVIYGGQLKVLKEWETLKDQNKYKNVIGVIICLIIWIFNFYITISFNAVWKFQNSAFFISFIFAFVLDFIVFEFGVELIICLFYAYRKNSETWLKIGFFLNELRDYRVLNP